MGNIIACALMYLLFGYIFAHMELQFWAPARKLTENLSNGKYVALCTVGAVIWAPIVTLVMSQNILVVLHCAWRNIKRMLSRKS